MQLRFPIFYNYLNVYYWVTVAKNLEHTECPIGVKH